MNLPPAAFLCCPRRESEFTRLQREAYEASQMDIARRQAEEEAERKNAAEHARHAMEVAKKKTAVVAGGGGGGTTATATSREGVIQKTEIGKGKMKEASPESASPKGSQHGRNLSV